MSMCMLVNTLYFYTDIFTQIHTEHIYMYTDTKRCFVPIPILLYPRINNSGFLTPGFLPLKFFKVNVDSNPH